MRINWSCGDVDEREFGYRVSLDTSLPAAIDPSIGLNWLGRIVWCVSWCSLGTTSDFDSMGPAAREQFFESLVRRLGAGVFCTQMKNRLVLAAKPRQRLLEGQPAAQP